MWIMALYPGNDLLKAALGMASIIAQGGAAYQGFPPAVVIIQLSHGYIEFLP